MTMTEREKYLEHRITHVRRMLRELESELDDIRQRRIDAYLDRLETSCEPSRLEHISHD